MNHKIFEGHLEFSYSLLLASMRIFIDFKNSKWSVLMIVFASTSSRIYLIRTMILATLIEAFEKNNRKLNILDINVEKFELSLKI